MAPVPAPSMALLASLSRCSRRSTVPTQQGLSRSLHATTRTRPMPLASMQSSHSTGSHASRSRRPLLQPNGPRSSRALTMTPARFVDADPPAAEPSSQTPPSSSVSSSISSTITDEPILSPLASLSRAMGLDSGSTNRAPRDLPDHVANRPPNEHHIYIYAHKHNTHVTLAGPQYIDPKTKRTRQDIMLTLSCGNIGYRKAQRSTFDAAYQLGSYFLSRVRNDGLLMKIGRLELVFRGFGKGRDAFTKLFLGQEGAILRDRVCRVVDSSRLKFGGQRAPKPRRLG